MFAIWNCISVKIKWNLTTTSNNNNIKMTMGTKIDFWICTTYHWPPFNCFIFSYHGSIRIRIHVRRGKVKCNGNWMSELIRNPLTIHQIQIACVRYEFIYYFLCWLESIPCRRPSTTIKYIYIHPIFVMLSGRMTSSSSL